MKPPMNLYFSHEKINLGFIVTPQYLCMDEILTH